MSVLMTATRRNRRHGFTLVEVLVSLAIFSVAAVALGAAYVNLILAHDALRRVDPRNEAMRLVRRAMLVEPDLAAAEAGGEVVLFDERSVHWSAEIEPLPVADLFRVSLEVRLPAADGGPADEIHEAHTLLRPSWSVAAERQKLLDWAKERLSEERARQ